MKILIFFLFFPLLLIIPSAPTNPPPTPTPLPTLAPSPTPLPTPTTSQLIMHGVPFVSQAPFGDWSDPRQQDGCEEASVLIAMAWATYKPISRSEALLEIHAMAKYQEELYGTYTDTSVEDTQKRLIRGYYNYFESEIITLNSPTDLISSLSQNNLIIIPANGRLLGNPNFTPPGPERHNLVIIGYDAQSDEFITHDPGTRLGENYRYSKSVLYSAIRDYPTGNHVPISPDSNVKKAILVRRSN